MPQSFASLHYHLIFSTKDRVPLINTELQPRLFDDIGGVLRNCGGALLAGGGMPDHVHRLVALSRTQSIADTLRTIKANSSGWVHETFEGFSHFAWQAGYAAFAVSNSNLDDVRDYLERHAEHHRVKSFQEEYRSFLRKHEIEFDERHVWE